MSKFARFLALSLALVVTLGAVAFAPVSGGFARAEGEEPSETASAAPTETEKAAAPLEEPADSASPSPSPSPTPTESPSPTPTEAPTESPSPSPTPTESPSPSPSPTPIPTPPSNWGVGLSRFDAPTVPAGGRATLAIPVAFYIGSQIDRATNARGGGLVTGPPSASDIRPDRYDEGILERLVFASVTLKASSRPLALPSDRTAAVIDRAAAGNEWKLPEGTAYNLGFAYFEDVPIADTGGDVYVEIEFRTVYGDRDRVSASFRLDVAAAPTVSPSPEPSPSPTPTGEPSPTPPEPSPSPTPEGDPEPPATQSPESRVDIGQMTIPRATPGEKVTLAVPIRYRHGAEELHTNRRNGALAPYDPSGGAPFDADIAGIVEYLTVSLTQDQLLNRDFPLTAGEVGLSRQLIAGGVNRGYAAFSDLTVKGDAQNGTYEVRFDVRWKDAFGEHEKRVAANLTVYGAKSPGGGGGYGGGGGGGSSGPKPQTKLQVTSLITDPSPIRAGEPFDLIAIVFNTNERQFVQNLKLTITAEDDAFLPIAGSNTAYIQRIDALSDYVLTMRMRSRIDAPDAPVKVDVLMEFEDQSVQAHSESQQLYLNIEPVFRVVVEDPVPADMGAAYALQPHTARLQVTNLGRTTLYNVSVTAACDSEDLQLPFPFVIGNMEGGASKVADLELFPMAEGEYAASFVVRYENAAGDAFEIPKTYGFYANAEDTGYYNPYEDLFPPPEEPPEPEALSILRALPWWLYAAPGALLVLIVAAMGANARARRRKALLDDEMD